MTDALLLIHAFPVDGRLWEPQLAAFSGAVPVLAPHLPGFGGSEPGGEGRTVRAAGGLGGWGGAGRGRPPRRPGCGGSEPAGEVMTMRAAADRMLGELEHAGIDRALVCGLSMGGYVAFELWRRARERVLGLVLANTRAQAEDR